MLIRLQMVADAKDDLFDNALLFSNDSDMTYAVRIVVKNCKKCVGLVINGNDNSFKNLKENVVYIKRINDSMLAQNQLPDEVLILTGRRIHKPKE